MHCGVCVARPLGPGQLILNGTLGRATWKSKKGNRTQHTQHPATLREVLALGWSYQERTVCPVHSSTFQVRGQVEVRTRPCSGSGTRHAVFPACNTVSCCAAADPCSHTHRKSHGNPPRAAQDAASSGLAPLKSKPDGGSRRSVAVQGWLGSARVHPTRQDRGRSCH